MLTHLPVYIIYVPYILSIHSPTFYSFIHSSIWAAFINLLAIS